MALLNPHAEYSYRPREVFLPLHQRQKRWACVVAHRRAGKTVALVNDLIIGALECQLREPKLAFVAPTYTQAQRIAWDYLKIYSEPYLEKKPNETELSVQLIGKRRIYLVGADNPDSLRGIYLDGAVLDEFAFAKPSVWTKIILPALSDRGGWGVISSTPNGPNEFKSIYDHSVTSPDWLSLFLPVSVTGLIAPDELANLRASMTEEEYAQEFECSFQSALRGSIFGKWISAARDEGRIGSFEYDGSPTNAYFDLGYSDATAIWLISSYPGRHRAWKYHENSRQSVDYYIYWLKTCGLEIDTVWLPHDGSAHTLITGRSIEDQFRRAGFKVRIAPRLSIADGIAATRKVLPYVEFDRINCQEGLDAAEAYHYQYDELKQTLRQSPEHDWSSHGADALRTFGVAMREVPAEEKKPPPKVLTLQDMTLEGLYAANELSLSRPPRARI